MNRRSFLVAGLGASLARAQLLPVTAADKETFLLKAKVRARNPVGKGVTEISRLTLSDGNLTHDAAWQTIDIFRKEFKTAIGVEQNFRDCYRYSVAAYRLDRLLGIHMIPPTVERRISGVSGALAWWVDDVLMDEEKRRKTKLDPDNPRLWNYQWNIMQVFDQLIYNTDRNLGNILITRDWNIWMIDHTRAFRLFYDLHDPGRVNSCDRQLLAAMQRLDNPTLNKELGSILNSSEIKGILMRRDRIVAKLAALGEHALYDSPRRD